MARLNSGPRHETQVNGYPLEPSHLNLDVYRLLLPFAASHTLRDLSGGNDSDPINQMREQFEQSEACRLLLTVAVTMRNSVEKRCNSLVTKTLGATVGTLVADIENPTDSALSFLEACHKIIHATDISFLDPATEGEGLAPLSTQIKLSGEKPVKNKTIEWEATLDVAEFARQAYRLT